MKPTPSNTLFEQVPLLPRPCARRWTVFAATGMLILLALAWGAEASRVCGRCGKRIDGKFITAQNKYYHPEHFLCFYCDKPMEGDYIRFEDHNYHQSCYKMYVALRCSYCRELIEGDHLVDYWGNAYHLEHEQDAIRCEYCGRFISEVNTYGGVEYDDGRHICTICRRNAVETIDEARELMEEVQGYLSDIGLRIDGSMVTLHVVDLEEMLALAGDDRHTLKGYTSYELTKKYFGLSKQHTLDVYVLYGMPKEQAVTTLAHELTHVWQIQRGRLENDPAFNEGSCNYVAYLVLERYDGEVYDFMRDNLIENEDPTYGEGLRRVKKFAEEKGVEEWLARLQTEENLPEGY